jgi:hypothetical protein
MVAAWVLFAINTGLIAGAIAFNDALTSPISALTPPPATGVSELPQ